MRNKYQKSIHDSNYLPLCYMISSLNKDESKSLSVLSVSIIFLELSGIVCAHTLSQCGSFLSETPQSHVFVNFFPDCLHGI